MKWIKVNERLPDSKVINTYFVKLRMKNSEEGWFPGAITYSGEWEISEDYEVIEWLDENENEAICYHCGDVIEHPLCRGCDIALTLPTEEY